MSTLVSSPVDLSTTPADKLRSIDDARRFWFPRRPQNRPVSPSTVYRWAKKGVKGVRLKLLYTAAGAVTSEAACQEFLTQVDAARRGEMSAAECIDASDDELRRSGLLGGKL